MKPDLAHEFTDNRPNVNRISPHELTSLLACVLYISLFTRLSYSLLLSFPC